MRAPLIANLGPTELLIILAIIVLLFGAAKLPELARGSGRALRIFKAETKGLDDGSGDSEDDSTRTPEQRELEARNAESERLLREQRQQRDDPA